MCTNDTTGDNFEKATTTESYENTMDPPVGTMGPVTVDKTQTKHTGHEGDSLSTIQIATICFVSLGVSIFIIVIMARIIYWKSKQDSSRDSVVTANHIHRPRVAYVNRGIDEVEV